jgi:hypothetical protein
MIVVIFLVLLVYVVLPPAALSAGATLLLCWLRPRLPIELVALAASLLASAIGMSWVSFDGLFEMHCHIVPYLSCGDPGTSFTSYMLLVSMLITFAIAWPVSWTIGNWWHRR